MNHKICVAHLGGVHLIYAYPDEVGDRGGLGWGGVGSGRVGSEEMSMEGVWML